MVVIEKAAEIGAQFEQQEKSPIPKRRVFDRDWLVRKVHDAHLAEAARNYASGRMLDIGCGEKPYEGLFHGHVTDHVGLDHEGTFAATDHIDVFGTAYDCPFGAESFDTILSTVVLEHLEEPAEAMAEMNRVLKRGGKLILSAPLFWPVHESPRDFFRYTEHGLRHLLSKNGFEPLSVKPLSGFWVTWAEMIVYYLLQYRHKQIVGLAIPWLIAITQLTAYLFVRLRKDNDHRFTWCYLVAARKV